MEIDFVLAFVSGLVFGFSPCILLLLSTFGTSMIFVEEKSKFIQISVGLITGLVITYILISYLIYIFAEFSDIFRYLNFIFAGVLIFIGCWQIFDSKKDESKLFDTPERVKSILKNFIDKNSGLYAFFVGIIFSLIKLPTCGALLIVLIINLHSSPILFLYIMVYIIGMITPIILVLILLRLGLESEKVNEFRLKHRRQLRIFSGVILIFLAVYLLILDDLFFSGG